MPYESINDLPESVREHLPEHAQDIFKEAFNNAFEQYDHDETRAFRVAWAAVKKEYQKDKSGNWVKKTETKAA